MYDRYSSSEFRKSLFYPLCTKIIRQVFGENKTPWIHEHCPSNNIPDPDDPYKIIQSLSTRFCLFRHYSHWTYKRSLHPTNVKPCSRTIIQNHKTWLLYTMNSIHKTMTTPYSEEKNKWRNQSLNIIYVIQF